MTWFAPSRGVIFDEAKRSVLPQCIRIGGARPKVDDHNTLAGGVFF
jgi:hypothetical protein